MATQSTPGARGLANGEQGHFGVRYIGLPNEDVAESLPAPLRLARDAWSGYSLICDVAVLKLRLVQYNRLSPRS
jgi:hypothetical protein